MNSKSQKKTLGKRTTGVVVHPQVRELIVNVIGFMKEEAELYKSKNQVLVPLADYKERVCAATGISPKIYEAVLKETAKMDSSVLADDEIFADEPLFDVESDNEMNYDEDEHESNDVVEEVKLESVIDWDGDDDDVDADVYD